MNGIKTFMAVVLLVFLFEAASMATIINESEPNNSFATAQDLDGWFSLDFSSDIPFSDTIPHVTIQGSGDGVSFDYFSFSVVDPQSWVIFDFDGYNPKPIWLAIWNSNKQLLFDIPFKNINDDRNDDAFIWRYQVTSGKYYAGLATWTGAPYPLPHNGWTSLNTPLPNDEVYTLHVSVGRPVPEPGTFFLLGFGLLGIASLLKRRGAK